MDESDLEYFRTLLEERVSEAEEALAAIGDATDPVAPDVSIGRLSRLDSMQMREMSLEQKRRAERQLRNLQEAMERLEAGRFGVCDNCGEGIGFSRLQARPEAVTCQRCLDRMG